MSTSEAVCRICGSTGEHPAYRVREMMFGTREEFPYFHCAHCGCLQIRDIPNDLSGYYPADYYSIGQTGGQPRHWSRPRVRAWLEHARARTALFGTGYRLNRVASQIVDLPPEINPAGRWLKACGIRSRHAAFLDVGCGSRSWWLNNLQALGFTNLTGLDPHIQNDIVERGITIRKAHLDKIDGRFDLISLHHSLEHIPDQLGTLLAVKDRLKPGGSCLIRIPLVTSTVWERYGTDWVELDAPRHLYLHSHTSIAQLGHSAGLDLIHTMHDSSAFEFYGSEQYRRDIPLNAANSYWRTPDNSEFTFREMATFTAMAEAANRDGRGGRGCFVFRKSGNQAV